MTITTLPDVPLRTDAPETFVAKADAFMGALPTLVDELNTFGASLTTLSTNSTSTTSLTIGTGSKTLTVETGKSYQIGMSVKIASTVAGTNWMHGDVTAYNSGTGSLTVSVSTTNGSGTVAAWTVSASAPGGATLASNTFSGAQNEAQGSDIASAATLNLSTATGNYVHVTGTTGITAITLAQGYERTVVFDGALTLTHGASLILPGAVSITTAAGDVAVFRGEAASVVRCVSYVKASGASPVPAAGITVRQTVMGGPVTAAGLADFLPASAVGLSVTSQNVTSTAPFVVAAAGGFGASGGVDRIGYSSSNLTWSGLTNTATNYLYVDVAASGALTTGSTTTAPVYQWGGTPATTSGLATFNVAQMQMFVGNGSTAPATYRVFVGEAVCSGGNVASTVAYAYQNRYDSGWTNTLFATKTVTHNLGIIPGQQTLWIKNLTTDGGYGVGEVLQETQIKCNGSVSAGPVGASLGANSSYYDFVANTNWELRTKTANTRANLTAANWAYRITASRGW